MLRPSACAVEEPKAVQTEVAAFNFAHWAYYMSDKELAKTIILEIVRQAGGVFTNQTNLYKAFYHAHIKYASDNPGLMSTWPIVRMPRGPGIHRADKLLKELIASGQLEIHNVAVCDKVARRFVLTEKGANATGTISKEMLDAIRFGVNQVQGKTADRVSQDSHEQSRAWRNARNGDELAIYTDLLTDDEYADAKARTARAAAILKRLV